MSKLELVDINSTANFIQIHTKRTLLARKIREKWNACFLKERGNKPVYHLIEYGKDTLYNHIFAQKFDSHFIIQDNLIKPVGEFGKWVYVMLNPCRWQCGNDWEYHAMILINYLSVKSPQKLTEFVNIQGNQTGKTALHYAVGQGWPSIVNTLLKIPGIDINRRDYNGETPLYRSFMSGCPVSIPISLIWHGADVRIPDNKNFTPLNMALLFWNNEWFVPVILEYFPDYDIHSRDHHGFDMLRWAVECKLPGVVKKLLEMGADVNSEDNRGISTKNSVWVRDNKEISKLFNVAYREDDHEEKCKNEHVQNQEDDGSGVAWRPYEIK